MNILVGEDLAARLPDFALLELDLIRVVGRDAPERIFALMGPPEMSSDPAFVETGARMAAVLEAYRSRDWGGAEAALEKLRAAGTPPGLEGVAAVYATRVADFRLNPPSDDWDGISQALEK